MNRDMTTGSEWRHIVLFALPLFFGNLLQQLYSTVDSIVVGNFVGQNALAAVGSCSELAFIFLAVAMGMSVGSGILVSQLFGAQRTQDLRRAASSALIMLAALGAVISLLGVAAAPFLMKTVLNIEEADIRAFAVDYFRVYAAGLIFQYIKSRTCNFSFFKCFIQILFFNNRPSRYIN